MNRASAGGKARARDSTATSSSALGCSYRRRSTARSAGPSGPSGPSSVKKHAAYALVQFLLRRDEPTRDDPDDPAPIHHRDPIGERARRQEERARRSETRERAPRPRPAQDEGAR